VLEIPRHQVFYSVDHGESNVEGVFSLGRRHRLPRKQGPGDTPHPFIDGEDAEALGRLLPIACRLRVAFAGLALNEF